MIPEFAAEEAITDLLGSASIVIVNVSHIGFRT
jgi:hypothetical protein